MIASFELDAIRATFQPPRTGVNGQKMIKKLNKHSRSAKTCKRVIMFFLSNVHVIPINAYNLFVYTIAS